MTFGDPHLNKESTVFRQLFLPNLIAVREFMNESAASAASADYVKFQAAIKSAASARGGRASGRLDHGLFFAIVGRASAQKMY